MKIVLYINGKLGVWMCFEHDTCVKVHVECLRVRQAAYRPCAWLDSKHQFVHLVIDSEHAEINAYPLQPVGTAMRRFSHRKALRETLSVRFPETIIRTPDKSAKINALLVQKMNLSELNRNWLTYVEKSSITFCSVATTAEIVANLFEYSDQPYLVVCNLLGHCKHTYCVSGHALFTRSIEHTTSYSIVGGLEETLAHLRTTEHIDTAVRVYLVGLNDQQIIGVSELEWVDQIVQCDTSTLFTGNEQYKLADDAKQYGSVIHIAQHLLNQTSLQQHNSKRYVSLALSKHQKLIMHRRSRIQLATLFALAVCSVVYSGSRQWQEQQKQNEYVQAEAALSLEIDNAIQALLDESPIGIALSDALLDTQSLNASVGPSPAFLFPIIATVFTQHREVILQELSWVTIDSSAADNIAAQEIESNGVFTEQIIARDRISTEHKTASKLLVNIIAKSSSTATLREQQSALNAVVSLFDRNPSVSNLIVLEAPLANAANDDRIDADALNLANSFRFQFQIERNSSNEI